MELITADSGSEPYPLVSRRTLVGGSAMTITWLTSGAGMAVRGVLDSTVEASDSVWTLACMSLGNCSMTAEWSGEQFSLSCSDAPAPLKPDPFGHGAGRSGSLPLGKRPPDGRRVGDVFEDALGAGGKRPVDLDTRCRPGLYESKRVDSASGMTESVDDVSSELTVRVACDPVEEAAR